MMLATQVLRLVAGAIICRKCQDVLEVVCSKCEKKGVIEQLERNGSNGAIVRPYSPTAEEHGPNGLAVRFLDGSCVFEAPL